MIAIQTRPGYVTFRGGVNMETWEEEYVDFVTQQEQEEREQREAEELLQWHLTYQAKPRNENERRD